MKAINLERKIIEYERLYRPDAVKKKNMMMRRSLVFLLTGESTVTGTHRAVQNGPVGPLGRYIDADVQRSCTLISPIRCQTLIQFNSVYLRTLTNVEPSLNSDIVKVLDKVFYSITMSNL